LIDVFLRKNYDHFIFAANAIGGYPFIGTPDKTANELADLSRTGARGIAFSLVN
jgi:hypothetical protein